MTLLLIFTLMSISAAIYVAFNKSLIANSIWSISNIGFIWYNITVQKYEMVLLFSVYEITALFGGYNLKFRKNNENTN